MNPAAATSLGIEIDADRVRAQLKRWQERVLDIAKSNPLLGLNRSRVAKLHITSVDINALFEQLVKQEQDLRMPLVRRKAVPAAEQDLFTEHQIPEEQLPDEPYVIEEGDICFDGKPLDLLRRTRRIYDNARMTQEERGVTTLFVTFGILRWRDELFGDCESPLWMIPCELINKGPNAPLRLKALDEETQLNPALEYCLRERHKIQLPPVPEDLDFASLPKFLESAAKAVQEQHWAFYPTLG